MDIEALRFCIDQVDDTIILALKERLNLARLAGTVKKERRLPIEDLPREAAALTRVSATFSAEEQPFIARIYAEIFALSKNEQAKL